VLDGYEALEYADSLALLSGAVRLYATRWEFNVELSAAIDMTPGQSSKLARIVGSHRVAMRKDYGIAAVRVTTETRPTDSR